MAKAQKITDKLDQTAQIARDTATNGVNESRTLAAEVLDSLGSRVRKGTKTASRTTEKAGTRVANVIEEGADKVRGKSGGTLFGYFGRHPMRLLLFLGLMTGVVAIIALPAIRKRRGADSEIDPITGRDLNAYS